MSSVHRLRTAAMVTGAAAGLAIAPAAQALASSPASFIGHFHKISTLASTVPRNGDVNPYGTVVIRHSRGRLRAGDVLISNFNNQANLQGTGRTIVEISPSGHRTLFARIGKLPGACPGGVGLSTALAVLPGGWVVVGSTPSTNGQASTAKAGCLIVLGRWGRVRETISGHGINGPWDATSLNLNSTRADLFVTNVLNGTVAAHGSVVHRGTVLRLLLHVFRNRPPQLEAVTKIGSGFAEQTNATAFVLGPTGVGLGRNDTLYVADTRENRITAIANAAVRGTSAGTGAVVTRNGALANPLGLAIAPNGHVLTVNGNDGRIVETTPGGAQIATRLLDSSGSPKGAGALFGLAVVPGGRGVYYVDDAVNTLRLLH
ncbi:MAG TPA: hypothetical protein VIJ82_09545 [Streptosporangiaceae bacterium]|jgi:hypothetical protein